jgi:hypothetical protein
MRRDEIEKIADAKRLNTKQVLGGDIVRPLTHLAGPKYVHAQNRLDATGGQHSVG